MRLVRHLRPSERPFGSPVVTLGNFDGFHLGHRAIIERTVERARSAASSSVVFTFTPHPIAVLKPGHAPAMITSLARRLLLLRRHGVDGVVVRRFTREFARLLPEDFVRQVLIDSLGVRAVVVGYNVNFGRDRTGTPALLAELGARLGFDVEIVPPVVRDGVQVSSSLVRKRIAEGDVEGAADLLGRPHALLGKVRVGDRRGATIGFPTANVYPRGGMLPPDGVYAVRVGLDGEAPLRPGVANLGTNPTFGVKRRRLETHLFDHHGELYGRAIEVTFQKRLRGEEKFPSLDALVRQIRTDAGIARRLLDAAP